MPGRVADASLLAAVAFGEPEAAAAAALIGEADLYEPTLLGYELASIARKKISNYPEQRDGLLMGLRAVLSLDIHWIEPDHLQVIDLALESGLSTYDASYLHLARTLAVPLATYDRKMRVAAETLGLDL
ncbi:MAG: type II toxin-antitoxin system VapC family toxin [Chloroflexi bacterium]|nr:type II toxin-antitoxin system VapC family toxin [Chloroflexota bacterium]